MSVVGTWMQNVAAAWLVLQLTHDSAFALALFGACSYAPVLVFGLYAGTLVDRFPRRDVLLVTQVVSLVGAVIYAVLTANHTISFPIILVLAAALGVNQALYFPARQATVLEMVGRGELASAVALNSTAFNLARIVGPAIGGIVIAAFGVAACFWLNGASYLGVIAALLTIRRRPLTAGPLLSALELIVEAAEVGLRLLPQLDRDDVPERVRREVADAHVRPVHVLEHAVREVGWLQSEVLAHLRVEGLRQVAHLEAPGEELALDLEAQDDVQAIRHLVGVDAPERRLHLVQRALERLDRHVGELRKLALQQRIEVPPSRGTPAYEVLPHATLRLMERRRDAVAERRAREPRVDLTLVQPVPELVQARQDAVDVVVVEPRRQPNVVDRHRHLEGMHGVVEPPGLVVHPPRLENRDGDAVLRVTRERPA